MESGSALRAQLDAYSRYVQTIPKGSYAAQLHGDIDFDSLVTGSRTELQAALNAILEEERAEAASLKSRQDERGLLSNAFHTHLAVSKGFFYGAWGLVKTAREYSDLINPLTFVSNGLVAAWGADASGGKSWIGNFLGNFHAAQHRELVEALGVDPSSISREQLAEAYETATFIFDDGQSRAMFGEFATEYVLVQNREELAEFGGGGAFEIVLSALLVGSTAGVGLAARGVAAAEKLQHLKRLSEVLKALGAHLKSQRIQRDGKARGQKTEAQTVKVERPKELKLEPATRQEINEAKAKQKKQRNKPPPPMVDEPHTIIERPGKDGQYTTHYGDGTYKQYRGSGKDHGPISRPNVKYSHPEIRPDGAVFYSDTVRKAKPDEIPGK